MKKKITCDIILEIILYIAVLGYIIYGIFSKNNSYLVNGILTAIVMAMPRIIMKIFKFKASPFLNFLVQFFIFISMFLGKLNNFYGKFLWWDFFLHAVSGLVIFLVAYVIFLLQNNCSTDNINISLILTYIFLFCVAMTAIWEMWEFAGDMLFGLNSQGASLIDTMEDIIAGSTGPLIMVPFLYFHLKGKKNRIFSNLADFIIQNNKKYSTEE